MRMATSAFDTKVQMQGQTPAILCEVGERLLRLLASNRRLSNHPSLDFQTRRRIEAVIACLIEALDDLDGDPDLEQTTIEAGGAGFRHYPLGDDGEPDDISLALR